MVLSAEPLLAYGPLVSPAESWSLAASAKPFSLFGRTNVAIAQRLDSDVPLACARGAYLISTSLVQATKAEVLYLQEVLYAVMRALATESGLFDATERGHFV
jgi:hypothetical protein